MNETYGVLALGALAATATDVLSSADVLTSGGKLKQDTVSLLCPGASGRRDQATLLGVAAVGGREEARRGRRSLLSSSPP